jgi:hypothetical protein
MWWSKWKSEKREIAERQVLDELGLPSGQFVVFQGREGYLGKLKRKGFIQRYVPLFSIERLKKFSLNDLLTSFMGAFITRQVRYLSLCKSKLSTKMREHFVGMVHESIKGIWQQLILAATESYATVYDQFVERVIKESRNDFRKQLLQKMGETSKIVFTKTTRNSLDAIVEIAKQEYAHQQREKNGDVLVVSGTNALPEGTKFVFQRANVIVYAVEQIPQVRSLHFGKYDANGYEEKLFGKRYTMSLPYVVFLLVFVDNQFVSLRAFFRTKPLGAITDTLFVPAFSNISSNGCYKVCMHQPVLTGSHAQMTHTTIANYWGSTFNLAHWNTYAVEARERIPELASLEKWQEASVHNPKFVMNTSWLRANVDLQQAAEFSIAECKPNKNKEDREEPIVFRNQLDAIAEQVSQAIQESCFFLVPHWGIDDESVKKAKSLFTNQAKERTGVILQGLESNLNALFSEDGIGTVCDEIINDTITDLQVLPQQIDCSSASVDSIR